MLVRSFKDEDELHTVTALLDVLEKLELFDEDVDIRDARTDDVGQTYWLRLKKKEQD